MSAMPQGATRLDFAALIDQHGRFLQVETALPSLALIPERMVLRDAVSQPFELVLDCLSTSALLELKLLVGEQISVRLLQPDGRYKPWHGYVLEAAQLGSDGGFCRYRLTMRPWFSLLALREDCFVFQDKDARQILEDVFRDYPQANFRFDISEPLRVRSLCLQYNESDLDFAARLLAEEGLSYHVEHLDGEAAADADTKAHARHVLVITDRHASRLHLGDARFTSQHPSANLAGQKDAITAFAAARQVQPNAVAVGSWNYRTLAGASAEDTSALELGTLPSLEVYDGSGAYRYQNAEHAQRAAALALAALELDIKRFEGQGSTRHFEAGRTFALVDHPLYGANTSAFSYAGALTASRQRSDNEFTILAVEHHCANNLGAQAAELLGSTDIEHGSYKNHFHAAPAAAPVVPRFIRKPTAPGLQTAIVVGVMDQAITTDRDHRVKVQFPWQRGEAPLPGGLAHTPSPAGAGEGRGEGGAGGDPGNAPGDERCGTWVRMALPAAGANWGAVFTPRLGTEVAVEFIEGDIDRPLILGALHGGQALPPFSAGVDSGVNHPGVLSGLHSESLDHSGFNQWALDDATGQLRMRLLCSYTTAQLGLGHLIQQAIGAQRGAWRGAGFEATTQGWASARAGCGLLVSTSARPATYGSAQGTQMDATEAVSQLRSARELGQRLSEVARAANAQALSSHDGGQAVERFIHSIDPGKDGKHLETVNGQDAKKAQGRELTDPVEAFDSPVVVLDTPSSAVFTSEASIAAYSGQDLSIAVQADVQHTAAHTWASVSGRTTSLYTHAGGVKAVAANGPLSLQAHTDELSILADQDVTIVSVNEEIRISAKECIELVGGDSSIVLKGPDITFSTPGTFAVKGSTHAFLGGGGSPATLEALPQGVAGELPTLLELRYAWHDLEPVVGAPYLVTFADGTSKSGTLDANGYACVDNPPDAGLVHFGFDSRPAQSHLQRTDNPAQGSVADVPDAAQRLLEAYLQAEDEAWADASFPDEGHWLDADDHDDQIGDYDYAPESAPPEDEPSSGTHDEMVIHAGEAQA